MVLQPLHQLLDAHGHYFFYAAPPRHRLRKPKPSGRPCARSTDDITGHLVDHTLTSSVYHYGKPTRCGHFAPADINDPAWTEEAGSNSLSILSYLAVAEHATGQSVRDAFEASWRGHRYYLSNDRDGHDPFSGPGTGNQIGRRNGLHAPSRPGRIVARSRRAADPRQRVATALLGDRREPEDSPLCSTTSSPPATKEPGGLTPRPPRAMLAERPLPSGIRSTGSIGITPIAAGSTSFAWPSFPAAYRSPRGDSRTRKPVPIDERFIDHWNYDPWTLDGRGKGQTLADGASFLLPYYLGATSASSRSPPSPGGPTPKLSQERKICRVGPGSARSPAHRNVSVRLTTVGRRSPRELVPPYGPFSLPFAGRLCENKRIRKLVAERYIRGPGLAGPATFRTRIACSLSQADTSVIAGGSFRSTTRQGLCRLRAVFLVKSVPPAILPTVRISVPSESATF